MTAVMLANHRRIAPFGVAGGSPGALGRNWVERLDRADSGERVEFGATFAVAMRAGRRLRRRDAGRRRLRAAAAGPEVRAASIIVLCFHEEAAMPSVYDFTVRNIRGQDVKLDTYKGKALLIVNTASECGFTPQYKGLETLYQKLPGRASRSSASPATSSGRRSRGTRRRSRISARSTTT